MVFAVCGQVSGSIMTAGMPKLDLAAISAIGDLNVAVHAWLPQKVGDLK